MEEITAWNYGNPPDIVWANAGFASPHLFIETPIETLRSQMDINYWSAAYLARAALKVWLRPEPKSSRSSEVALPCHLVMTSSVVAYIGIVGYSPYSPSKAAMRSLVDTLRSELELYRGAQRQDSSRAPAREVKIHCVFPGTILSPGYEEENKSKHSVTKLLEKSDPKQTPDEVAEASIRGLETGNFLIATQWMANLLRAGGLQGSPRNNWFIDTLLSFIVSIAWFFIGADLDGQVYKFGKEHGVSAS